MIVLEPFAAALEEALPAPKEDKPTKESPRIFIPFPGTTKAVNRKRFDKYDPVVLDCDKLISDPAKLKRIKGL